MVSLKKWDIVINTLCKGFPEEFTKYLGYICDLGFENKPDYNYLRVLFI
jgi:casein kinase 1